MYNLIHKVRLKIEIGHSLAIKRPYIVQAKLRHQIHLNWILLCKFGVGVFQGHFSHRTDRRRKLVIKSKTKMYSPLQKNSTFCLFPYKMANFTKLKNYLNIT